MKKLELTQEENAIIYNSLSDRRLQLLKDIEYFKVLPEKYTDELKKQLTVIENLIDNKLV